MKKVCVCVADVGGQGQSIIRALMTQYYLTVGCAKLVQVLSVTAKRVVLARYFEHTGRKLFHRHDFEPICTCGCDFDDAAATGSSYPRYFQAEINQGFGSLLITHTTTDKHYQQHTKHGIHVKKR